MSKNPSLKFDITSIRANASRFIKLYAGFAFLLLTLSIYGFLVFKINTYSKKEPSDDDVSAVVNASRPPKIDQNSIDKIQQLRDQNIAVQSIFEQARDNPFQD